MIYTKREIDDPRKDNLRRKINVQIRKKIKERLVVSLKKDHYFILYYIIMIRKLMC